MTTLRAARLFDGEHFVDNPMVVIDGGTITRVGGIPSGDVTDLGDVTLMPGLIDSHQHLIFTGLGTLEEQVAEMSDDDLRERARANAQRALTAGITTIRDLGDRRFVTLDLCDDPSLPTILPSGPPLTAEGGHCWFLGGECAGIDALTAAVRERKERGCAVVKIMMTGGALTPTFPMWKSQFTTEELRAVIETAHDLGLPVAAHCHGIGGIASAVEAGVDTIEHCTFFGESGHSEPDEALLKAIVAAGIPISGTLGRLPGGQPPPVIQASYDAIVGAMQFFRQNGGTLIVGTDAGIGPLKPHNVLPYALAELQEHGWGSEEVLTATTSLSARVLGVGDRKGRLAPGYDADLAAFADDALLDVRGVWLRGEQVL